MNNIGIALTVAIDAGAGTFNVVAKPTALAAIEAKGKLGEEIPVVSANRGRYFQCCCKAYCSCSDRGKRKVGR